MGTTGTSSALASCSSLPFHTSCGSSDGSRGYSIAFGAFSSSATKSRSSSVGMLTRVSFLCPSRRDLGRLLWSFGHHQGSSLKAQRSHLRVENCELRVGSRRPCSSAHHCAANLEP